MPGFMTQSKETGSTQLQENRASNECGHQTLMKVESKIREADKDAQIYVRAIRRKLFAVDAY